jgi:hypothetical protein
MLLLGRPPLLWALVSAESSQRLDAASAERKLARIERTRLPAGTVVVFSGAEVNAFVRSQIPMYAPGGVRQAVITLGPGSAEGTALVDFVKLRRAAGVDSNWMVERLIEGERLVKVDAHFQSSRGVATVFVDRVEISGVAVSGTPLAWLIDTFLKPLFPEAKINQPFALDYRVDHFDVSRRGVRVVLGR